MAPVPSWNLGLDGIEIQDADGNVSRGIDSLILYDVVFDSDLAALGQDGRQIEAPGAKRNEIGDGGLPREDARDRPLPNILQVEHFPARGIFFQQRHGILSRVGNPEDVHLEKDQAGIRLTNENIESSTAFGQFLE